LFVGRLSRRKGKETLERTLPELLEKRPDLEFVFVGKQPEPLDISAVYNEQIRTVGPVLPSEIPRYYRDADFLIHPSLIEGLPRVVLEALASRTPPIARNVGDVSYATENTFSTDDEFVEKVCKFECLRVDSVEPFLYETVEAKYIDLFADLVDS
jgi:glycosyltransferase involved in cell wall biosynthesis